MREEKKKVIITIIMIDNYFLFYINSHLKNLNIIDKEKYLNSLYGKILYVLQINNQDKEFINYKQFIEKYIIKKS